MVFFFHGGVCGRYSRVGFSMADNCSNSGKC